MHFFLNSTNQESNQARSPQLPVLPFPACEFFPAQDIHSQCFHTTTCPTKSLEQLVTRTPKNHPESQGQHILDRILILMEFINFTPAASRTGMGSMCTDTVIIFQAHGDGRGKKLLSCPNKAENFPCTTALISPSLKSRAWLFFQQGMVQHSQDSNESFAIKSAAEVWSRQRHLESRYLSQLETCLISLGKCQRYFCSVHWPKRPNNLLFPLVALFFRDLPFLCRNILL